MARVQATFFDFMFLFVMLVRLSYYYVIFYILTGQKRDVTELKFLWLVNMTFNSPKFLFEPCLRILKIRREVEFERF